MKLIDLQRTLAGSALADIVLGGFVYDDRTGARFHVSLRDYFLDCGNFTLRFGVRGDSGEGVVTVVPRVTCDLDLDEDMRFATVSVKEVYLRHPESANRIQRVVLWGPADRQDGVQCQALRIDVDSGQVLFLDPSYHFGIRLGGVDDENEWRSAIGGRARESVIVDTAPR